ncbi:hypothetical protein SAMN04490248_10149 [Salinihabitans flavidus]|uniref:Uncharacterized protein n=1 Tax=Salinihabitans flavidus TaxID=569882 RepID=A0A1H8L9K3_9RHOB|nr:hypothetical protein [Salinihabitans flavidus]SEO01793.1 hypothetical protein SAMN04490248_10149 [Salinihabitans flavidus]
MTTADTPRTQPLWQRILFMIPVVGWIARDLTYGSRDTVYYAIAAFVSLWGISALTFGIPGLYIPALIMVPLIWIVLIVIAAG